MIHLDSGILQSHKNNNVEDPKNLPWNTSTVHLSEKVSYKAACIIQPPFVRKKCVGGVCVPQGTVWKTIRQNAGVFYFEDKYVGGFNVFFETIFSVVCCCLWQTSTMW